jgi:hypothetical protein
MPHGQLITYTLVDIDPAAYAEQFVDPFAEYFATLETLITKVWLGVGSSGEHGGFLVWRDQAAMDAFMASEAVADIMSRPYVTDLTARDWPVDAVPSARTNGLGSARA